MIRPGPGSVVSFARYPSEAMQAVASRVERFASSPVPLLILGETGTGKDLCAHLVWSLAGSDRPFVALNCAAVPEALVESELFGHVKGAFTGAGASRGGLLARANGGILFLDEIAELPLPTQAKLLRAVEAGEFRPVGGDSETISRFRVLAATNAPLDAMVRRKRFREDLFHRLGAVRISMPPLRDRQADFEMLCGEFLASFRARNGGAGPEGLTEDALDLLRRQRWPGNIRQLRNVVEAGAAMAGESPVIRPHDLQDFLPTGEPDLSRLTASPTLEETVLRAEARAILEALRRASGNRSEAARILDVSEATLYRKMSALRALSLLPAAPDARESAEA